MPEPFNPLAWYWDVLDYAHGSMVYSSKDESFVLVTDTNYQAWLNKPGWGNAPTVAATRAALDADLNSWSKQYYHGGYASFTSAGGDFILTNPLASSTDFTATASGLSRIYLPGTESPQTVPIGVPILFRNTSATASYTMPLYAHDGTTLLATINPGSGVKLVLKNNNPQVWVASYEGNIVSSGTPTSSQLAGWSDANHQIGVTPGTGLLLTTGALNLDPDLASIAGYAGTGVWLYRAAANSWQAVGVVNGLTFNTSNGLLSADLAYLAANISGQMSTFRATLSADQTGIPQNAFTKINFNTAAINVGNNFNTTNGRWTPPAGRVTLGALFYGNVGAAANLYAAIYKNGAVLIYVFTSSGSNTITYAQCQIIDVANGTDYYEAYTLQNGPAGAIVYSGAGQTFFWGARF